MLETLELHHIRSYSSGLFGFKPGVNIVVGPNASGKTNLLEAIAMAASGSSFRSSDQDMITHSMPWGRIDGRIDGIDRSVKLREDGHKTYVFDGVDRKIMSHAQRVPFVLFEPNDMLLLGGEPERRRSYVDRILSETNPVYRLALQSYRRALSQRNKLLKDSACDQRAVFIWDVRLSEYATTLAQERQAYITETQGRTRDIYATISGANDVLSLTYESKLPINAEYSSALLKALQERYETDRVRGFTTIGPHRDDVRIMINNQDVRTDASRGETRSTVLSLKVAELEYLEARFEKKPLLLLDDVFSELDGRRRRLLANMLKDTQTFITTTDADVVVEHFGALAHIIPLEGR